MRLQSRFRWFPTPFRSFFLFIVWLLLNNSVSVGHIVLATFFDIFIPILSFSFRVPQPLILKPG
ncbi:cation:proton antiporter, partial [Pseudoalteromonas marina]|nr:cation:proton antiporter [Pseudoalteromonas marina]